MTSFGLTDTALKQIKKIFAHYPEILCVKIFGSRALGNFRPSSDIDLVAFGDFSDETIISSILGQLDELPLPYKFDLIHFEQIQHEGLREHISKFAKEI